MREPVGQSMRRGIDTVDADGKLPARVAAYALGKAGELLKTDLVGLLEACICGYSRFPHLTHGHWTANLRVVAHFCRITVYVELWWRWLTLRAWVQEVQKINLRQPPPFRQMVATPPYPTTITRPSGPPRTKTEERG
jgi:hypothetical protein